MANLPFKTVSREILVKKESLTDPNLGCEPDKRSVPELINYGIVNIDKPKGPTSHQVADYVQKILGIDKAGHSGTLDPAVTGVLPVALGKATRVIHGFLKAGKEYVGIMHVHKEVPESKIREIFEKFKGKIRQLPPVKSAVKRVFREREVYYLDVLEISGQDVLFVAGVEAGTYIRKLCFDIGKMLGVGAHMSELRRTKAGTFDESSLATLQDLADAYWYWKEEGNEKFIRLCVKPMEDGVQHLAKIWVLDSAVESLCHGMNLNVPGVSKLNSGIEAGELVAVLTLKGELIAFGEARLSSKQILKEQKGTAVSVNKVFMEPGRYKIIQ